MHNIGPLWIMPRSIIHNGGYGCSAIIVYDYCPVSDSDCDDSDDGETLRSYKNNCYKWDWTIRYTGKRYTISFIGETKDYDVIVDDPDQYLKNMKIDDSYNMIAIVSDHETGKHEIKNVSGDNYCAGCGSR